MKTSLTLIVSILFLCSCHENQEHSHISKEDVHSDGHHKNVSNDHCVSIQKLTLIESTNPSTNPLYIKVVSLEETENEYYIIDDWTSRELLRKAEIRTYSSHLFFNSDIAGQHLMEVLSPYREDMISHDLAGKLGCIGYLPHVQNAEETSVPRIDTIDGKEYVFLPCFVHYQSSGVQGFTARLLYEGDDKTEIDSALTQYPDGYVNIGFEELNMTNGYYEIRDIEIKKKH